MDAVDPRRFRKGGQPKIKVPALFATESRTAFLFALALNEPITARNLAQVLGVSEDNLGMHARFFIKRGICVQGDGPPKYGRPLALNSGHPAYVELKSFAVAAAKSLGIKKVRRASNNHVGERDKRIERALKLREAGSSYAQITKRLGIGVGSVSGYIHLAKERQTGVRREPSEVAEAARRLYASEKSGEAIARELGKAVRTIQDYLRDDADRMPTVAPKPVIGEISVDDWFGETDRSVAIIIVAIAGSLNNKQISSVVEADHEAVSRICLPRGGVYSIFESKQGVLKSTKLYRIRQDFPARAEFIVLARRLGEIQSDIGTMAEIAANTRLHDGARQAP